MDSESEYIVNYLGYWYYLNIHMDRIGGYMTRDEAAEAFDWYKQDIIAHPEDIDATAPF